jgi:hypothetical protein
VRSSSNSFVVCDALSKETNGGLKVTIRRGGSHVLEVVPGDLPAVFFVLGLGEPSIREIPQGFSLAGPARDILIRSFAVT